MATVYYPAIIERGAEGFSVMFPDLPGCASYGATVQQAAENAEAALASYITAAEELGEKIAPPSDIDAVEVDADVDVVARLLVRGETAGKSVRINITLDEGLVAAIDKVAPNRSGFLAAAAREKLRSSGPV